MMERMILIGLLAFGLGFVACPLVITAVSKYSEWADARAHRRGLENYRRDQERNGDLG